MRTLQTYISKELTHFVGQNDKDEDEQYRRLLKILHEYKLCHSLSDKITAFDSKSGYKSGLVMQIDPNAEISENVMHNPEMVCFCDIPKENLRIHIDKYSHFGLSFDKNFIIQHGGRPVYYVPIECPNQTRFLGNIGLNISDIFHHFAKSLVSSSSAMIIDKVDNPLTTIKESDLVNNIVSNSFLYLCILSYVKFFDHKLTDNDESNYYFEREWRVLGSLEFSISDVRSVYIPKCYKERFREEFPQYNGEIIHPEEL
jgi:hypothetical protein